MAVTQLIQVGLSLLPWITRNVDVFLDLTKAFETVDCNIVISKLQSYSIQDVILKWFVALILEI